MAEWTSALQVNYEVGSGGERLSSECMRSLDEQLVPVVHAAAAEIAGGQPMVIELLFHVVNM